MSSFSTAFCPARADRSYGIHVARLAGLPQEIVRRSREVLAGFESRPAARPMEPSAQLRLAIEPAPLVKELALADVDNMTPLEALNTIAGLRDRARAELDS